MAEVSRDRNPLRSMFFRWIINAIAIWAALSLLPGIVVEGDAPVRTILVVALIFGLINAVIRPIAIVLSCPLLILTLGLGTLVINALMFLLTSQIAQSLGLGFSVDGFWTAFWGALIVSLISWLLSAFLAEPEHKRTVDAR